MIREFSGSMAIFLAWLLVAMPLYLVVDANEEDRVADLPELSEQPTFKHYSGYLSGLTDNIQLHYWLVEAASNPESVPLLLWLNGGPGCSSLDGLLNENGPFMIDKNGKLSYRDYSWNNLANVLYLETPAGTGFSYAKNSVLNTSDDESGENNYYAMKNFLEKFPEYANRDLYIAGQSFAGVYIPMLAKRLVEMPMGLNLRGIAIGNGLTNNKFNDNSVPYYARYHGVIDEKMWSGLIEHCCGGELKDCVFTNGFGNAECKKMLINMKTKQPIGLDLYNIFRPCDGGIQAKTDTKLANEEFSDNMFVRRHRKAAEGRMYGSETCLDYNVLEDYLNREDVKLALHITHDVTWKVCNSLLPVYTRQYRDQKEFILQIMKGDVNVLIYNGDVDGVCNFIGGDWFAESLQLPETTPYSSWLYPSEKGEQQLGGYRKVYTENGNRVTFTTVRGSGHMVPKDTPAAAFYMIGQFLTTGELN